MKYGRGTTDASSCFMASAVQGSRVQGFLSSQVLPKNPDNQNLKLNSVKSYLFCRFLVIRMSLSTPN